MDQATRLNERERKLLDEALAALARTTGLRAATVTREPKVRKGKGTNPDAVIDIRGAGKRQRFIAELKTVDRAVTLATVKHQLERYGKQALLVTPYLTAELANHCRDRLDLQFIDAAGNAYLRAPGLFVFVKGEKPQGPAATAIGVRGGGTATALRVVFALLCKPELLNAPYRHIVEAAGVALGAVGWVFFDLAGRGLIAGGQRKRNRRFLYPKRLLDEWVTNFPVKLRPRLGARTFRAADPHWWRTVQPRRYGAVWGGEVAGDRLTGNREPGRFTLYVDGDPTRLILDYKFRADPHGDIEILDRFWNFQPNLPPQVPDIAPPILVYADLMATLDPRNHETAKLIYKQYLADALGKA